MGQVSGNMSELATSLGAVVTKLSTAKDNIRLVPNASPSDAKATINYRGKISDPVASNATTFPSIFVDILGSSGNGGIIGTFYSTIETTYSLLDGIKTGSTTFSANSGSFTGSISTITTSLTGFKTTLTDLDTQLTSALSTL